MSSQNDWHVEVDQDVLKTVKKFPRQDKGKILEVIGVLHTNPFAGDIQKISDVENAW